MTSDLTGVNLADKHLILKEDVLKSEYSDATWRVFYATGGFGCNPALSGTAVFGEFVRDGEKARYERYDFERLAVDEEIVAAQVKRAEHE